MIRNEKEYEELLDEIEMLCDRAPKKGTPEFQRLLEIADEIEAYEEIHYPIDPPIAQEMKDFLDDQGIEE